MKNIQILDSLVKNYSTNFLQNKYSKNEMPLLYSIFKKMNNLTRNNDLSNVIIVACQHLLIPQVSLFKKIIEIGIKPSNIYILPKAYSYNDKISNDLKSLGCIVVDSASNFDIMKDFDFFHKQQVKKISALFQNDILPSSKIIILDDGGLLIKTLNNDAEYLRKYQNQTFAVEQTNGGKNILKKSKLNFLVTSVASSREKLEIETDYIIRLATERIYEYFCDQNISINSRILILGNGTIGSSLARSLKKNNYSVFVYDQNQGKIRTD